VGEAGEAGAGVVDREPDAAAADPAEHAAQLVVVVDLQVLGELEHDAARARHPE
jgi:hypothetical protein